MNGQISCLGEDTRCLYCALFLFRFSITRLTRNYSSWLPFTRFRPLYLYLPSPPRSIFSMPCHAPLLLSKNAPFYRELPRRKCSRQYEPHLLVLKKYLMIFWCSREKDLGDCHFSPRSAASCRPSQQITSIASRQTRLSSFSFIMLLLLRDNDGGGAISGFCL